MCDPLTALYDCLIGVKKMSVLELLELQARARAIRSQLALEPVTKIELDSDNEDEVESVAASTSRSSKPTPSNSNPLPKPSTSNVNNGESNATKVQKEPEIKPVRLKRNFRQRQCSDYEEDDEDNETPPEKDVVKETATPEVVPAEIVPIVIKPPEIVDPIPSTAVEQPVSTSPTKERSPSPDIITIVPSPETLCISSDSENEDQQFLKRIKASNYIKMPEVTRETRPETEDEIFLRKLKRSATGTDSQTIATSSNTRSTKLISNSLVISVANDPKKPTNEPRKAADIFVSKVAASVVDPILVPDEEPVVVVPIVEASSSKTVEQSKETGEQEEGELTEDDEPENEIVVTAPVDPVKVVAAVSNASAELDTTDDLIDIDPDDEPVEERKIDHNTKEKAISAVITADVLISSDSSDSNDSSSSSSEDDDEKPTIAFLQSSTTLEIDDDDCDIIDLGKDEEMDFDADPVPSKKPKTDDEGNPEDVSCLFFCILVF